MAADDEEATLMTFKYNTECIMQISTLVRMWRNEKTEDNARAMLDVIWFSTGAVRFEDELRNLGSVGEIGTVEGKLWRPIPLVHQFRAATSAEYELFAEWRCNGDWERINGTWTDGLAR